MRKQQQKQQQQQQQQEMQEDEGIRDSEEEKEAARKAAGSEESAGGQPGTKILEWQDTHSLPWGILLLLGGGFALALGFRVFSSLPLFVLSFLFFFFLRS